MTNREKYGEVILDHIEKDGVRPAIVNGELVSCTGTSCNVCDLHWNCNPRFSHWLKSEYIPQPDIPLDTPIDTPILVWDDYKSNGVKRHFAGFENGSVLTWACGTTSWSVGIGEKISWKHAELANKEGNA